MAVRRLVQEAIDIVGHDAVFSDELPLRPQNGSEEMTELHIDTTVQEVNQLLDQASAYHNLLVDFPVGSILTPSEERLFQAAVSMSLAGTGLTANDLRVTVASTEGIRISQEGVGSAIAGVARAIGNAIMAVLRKIRDFFRWLTGSVSKEEKELQEFQRRLKKIDTAALDATLDKAVAEFARDFTGLMDDLKAKPIVRDVAPGAVIEGEFLVVNQKTTNDPAGSTTRVNLREMVNIPWVHIDRIFAVPPEAGPIALEPMADALRGTLEKLGTALPTVIKLIGKLDGRVDQLLKSQQTKPIVMISTMKELAQDFKAIRGQLSSAYHFEPQATEKDLLITAPVLPDGTAIQMRLGGSQISHTAEWADDFKGDGEIFQLSLNIPQRPTSTHVYSIKVGHPQAVASALDKCMKAYFHAFHQVEEITHELKLVIKTTSLAERSSQSAMSFSEVMLKDYEKLDPNDRVSQQYHRDLLAIKFNAVSSYAACYHLLADVTAMLSQYKRLYKWLPK